jgi:hypothetical protein
MPVPARLHPLTNGRYIISGPGPDSTAALKPGGIANLRRVFALVGLSVRS